MLLHQADTCAIYCRPVSRCETRVAVLVRDQTNQQGISRSGCRAEGGCQIRVFLDSALEPWVVNKKNKKAAFLPGGDHWRPEARPGTDQNTTAQHRWAVTGTEPSQHNRRAWSMSSRGAHKLHHDRCRWGLHSRATRLFPQPRPEKCPSGFQRLVGAGYRESVGSVLFQRRRLAKDEAF